MWLSYIEAPPCIFWFHYSFYYHFQIIWNYDDCFLYNQHSIFLINNSKAFCVCVCVYFPKNAQQVTEIFKSSRFCNRGGMKWMKVCGLNAIHWKVLPRLNFNEYLDSSTFCEKYIVASFETASCIPAILLTSLILKSFNFTVKSQVVSLTWLCLDAKYFNKWEKVPILFSDLTVTDQDW